MTLGQEFIGFAHTLREDFDRLSETIPWLNEINMGATAIGTGITADPRYADAVRRHLGRHHRHSTWSPRPTSSRPPRTPASS